MVKMRKYLLFLFLFSILGLCTACQSAEEETIETGTVHESSGDTERETETDESARETEVQGPDYIFCTEKVFADVRKAGAVCCNLKVPVLTRNSKLQVDGYELDGCENVTVELSELEETAEDWRYAGYYYTALPVRLELSEGECTIHELTLFVNGTAVKCEFPLGIHLEVCEGNTDFPWESGVTQVTIPQELFETTNYFVADKKLNLLDAELYSNGVFETTLIHVWDEVGETDWEEGEDFLIHKGSEAGFLFEFTGSEEYLSGPMTMYVCCGADDETYVMYDTTYKEAVSTAEDVPGFVKAILECLGD